MCCPGDQPLKKRPTIRRPLDDPVCTSVRVGASGQRVSTLAWRLHHEFKRAFVAPMPEEGDFIQIEEIRAWIEVERAGLANQFAGFDTALNFASAASDTIR